VKGVVENDPNKMKSSYGQKKDNVNSTKITHFNNGKQKDTILKHAKLRDKKEEDK